MGNSSIKEVPKFGDFFETVSVLYEVCNDKKIP